VVGKRSSLLRREVETVELVMRGRLEWRGCGEQMTSSTRAGSFRLFYVPRPLIQSQGLRFVKFFHDHFFVSLVLSTKRAGYGAVRSLKIELVGHSRGGAGTDLL
jgi:hypothetical protein